MKISIIIPVKNEASGLGKILPILGKKFSDAEIIVVDDGSDDETCEVAEKNNVMIISHMYSMGNGAAIKTGARRASGDVLVFMDGDGQHDPEDIPALLEKINNGYDMVIGARDFRQHVSLIRRLGNSIYNKLASFMTGYDIEDLTSGFRAAKAHHFRKFLYLLPNGFSYPTTSTMAFFRSGLSVTYVRINVRQRLGKSHISLIKDGLRFFIIILKIGALFSPMRLFFPIFSLLFISGISYYIYTYTQSGRFTNMSALLLLSSLIIFLIGIIAEHISFLHYKDVEQYNSETKE